MLVNSVEDCYVGETQNCIKFDSDSSPKNDCFNCLCFVCLFCCFTSQSTAMVMSPSHTFLSSGFWKFQTFTHVNKSG